MNMRREEIARMTAEAIAITLQKFKEVCESGNFPAATREIVLRDLLEKHINQAFAMAATPLQPELSRN